MLCPVCGSENVVKNGTIHNGKPKIMCKNCGRQSVEDPENKNISQEKKDIIDRLLLEKIPLAGIARAAGVSERWLQMYVNNKYDNVEKKL
jgi:transposase-like protein